MKMKSPKKTKVDLLQRCGQVQVTVVIRGVSPVGAKSSIHWHRIVNKD